MERMDFSREAKVVRTKVTKVVFADVSTWTSSIREWSEPSATEVRMIYDSDDPLAVTLQIEGVKWVFDRQLLIEASTSESGSSHGDGDVRTARVDDVVTVTLIAPTGVALLCLSHAAVLDFAQRMTTVVPVGSESYDVDEWLKGLEAS